MSKIHIENPLGGIMGLGNRSIDEIHPFDYYFDNGWEEKEGEATGFGMDKCY